MIRRPASLGFACFLAAPVFYIFGYCISQLDGDKPTEAYAATAQFALLNTIIPLGCLLIAVLLIFGALALWLYGLVNAVLRSAKAR